MSAGTTTQTKTETKLATVKLWNVVLLNDDYTPMDFVIAVLMQLFDKSEDEAYEITMAVHNNGKGIAGTFTKEIAYQKVSDVAMAAQAYGHPLLAVCEEQ